MRLRLSDGFGGAKCFEAAERNQPHQIGEVQSTVIGPIWPPFPGFSGEQLKVAEF
jgi:hypothetical protein